MKIRKMNEIPIQPEDMNEVSVGSLNSNEAITEYEKPGKRASLEDVDIAIEKSSKFESPSVRKACVLPFNVNQQNK